MSVSKKDGRKGGGHKHWGVSPKHRKWQKHRLRRAARRNVQWLKDEIEETKALDAELREIEYDSWEDVWFYDEPDTELNDWGWYYADDFYDRKHDLDEELYGLHYYSNNEVQDYRQYETLAEIKLRHKRELDAFFNGITR